MSNNKKIKVILEKSTFGYYAFTNDSSRIRATGSDVKEVKDNVLKALEARLVQLEAKGKVAQAELLRNCEVKYVFQV